MILQLLKKLIDSRVHIPLFSVIFLILLLSACTEQVTEQTEEEYDPYIYVSGSLKPGETLAQALQNKGLGMTAINPFINQLNDIYNMRRCQPADSFLVRIDSLNVMHELSYFPVRERIVTYSIIRDSVATYHTKIDTLQTDKVLRKIDTTISGSLYQSLRAKRVGPQQIVNFAEIFQWDFDFFLDTREGDRIQMIFEQYMRDGEFVMYGDILIAEYNGRSYKNRAYRYSVGGDSGSYYNKDGESFRKAFLRSPLNYTRISSRFSTGRYHPILKIVRPHNGVDYAAPTGTPVVASSDGVVSHVGWKGGHPTVNGMTGGYGRTVMIRHSNGYETLYGHLSRYGEGIRKGVRVSQNQVIGFVGQTGLATGPHLHYTVYHNGVAIDPLKMDNEPGPPIPADQLPAFKNLTDELDELIHLPVEHIRELVLN